MNVPRRTRSISLLLAAGSAPALLALALRGQPAPKLPPKAQPPHANEASLNVAHLLDGLAQDRFQDTTMVVFGLSRIYPQPARRQHPPFQLAPRNPHETAVLKAVSDARKDCVVSFLHCALVPGVTPLRPQAQVPQAFYGVRPMPEAREPQLEPLYQQPMISPVPDPYLTTVVVHASHPPSQAFLRQSLPNVVLPSLPTLRKGKEARAALTGRTVLMRPVRAAQDACLTCHTSAKRGDTLGVMVYAVGETANKN